MAQESANPTTKQNSASRRSFFALVTGALALLVPLGAGIAAFLTPLFRRSKPPTVRVALLSQVPDDGLPHFFPVVADREDAWNRYPQQRVGAVYLVRPPGERKPVAFTAKCPHAGCFIGFSPGDDKFQCPCHTSAFNFDGSRVRGDEEVSPRDMDTLTVELRVVQGAEGEEVTEVLVEYVNFQTGHQEKTPTA